MQPTGTKTLVKQSAHHQLQGCNNERPTLEEASRLVQGLLETTKEVHVEFFVFVDILTYPVQDDHLNKPLDYQRLCRDKNTGRRVATKISTFPIPYLKTLTYQAFGLLSSSMLAHRPSHIAQGRTYH